MRAALEALSGLAALDDLAEYPARVAETIREVLPCHHASYTAVDLDTGRAHIVADPADSLFGGGPEAFARFAHQNPLLADVASGGEYRAGRLSDFISRRDLHSTELYDHVYRHISLEYQIAMPLRAPGRDLGSSSEIVGVSVVRDDRDFSDSEKLLAELMRPQLSAILARLHEHALLRATESADAAGGRWALLIDAHGTVAWASRTIRADLELGPGRRLPGALLEWVREQRGRERDAAAGSAPGWGRPISLEGLSVQARLVAGAYPGLDAVHLRALRPRPTLAALRALDLTPRQAEVLQLALGGRGSPQIGAALRLSPRTVEKHMEAIYARLGAANRTEAVLIAARALDP